MARPELHIQTCPDCGGILQVTGAETLTSAEVLSSEDALDTAAPRQCLICGYEEAPGTGAAAV